MVNATAPDVGSGGAIFNTDPAAPTATGPGPGGRRSQAAGAVTPRHARVPGARFQPVVRGLLAAVSTVPVAVIATP